MQPTRFITSDSSTSDRVSGFIAHLREHGVRSGMFECGEILRSLQQLDPLNSEDVRLACKAVCVSNADDYRRFDDLFNAYWFAHGRQRSSVCNAQSNSSKSNRSLLQQHTEQSTNGKGNQLSQPDDTADKQNNDEGEQAHQGEGRLIGSRIRNIEKTDLRQLMVPEDLQRAEQLATQLASAIRDRRSRRRRADKRGERMDMRRVIRASVSHAGDPVKLYRQKRPDRSVNLVALLDVSGSMTVYAKVFLAFLKGLVSHDQRTDAYLFHTSLVRVSDALRDNDTFRAVNRLSMLAQGFGGGTKIGSNLQTFNQQYAARTITSRSVVIILSDGYDTDPPEVMAAALQKLKKRNCKIIWLNPLKGWKNYEPVAMGMAAALPMLDLFASANTLESLAALEPHLARL
jgi:uncharacterized protein with von Willebrand factor type A (vWA) domain